MLILTGFAFLSGVVTILSPCILPVLPLVLAGSAGSGRRRPLGIVAGFVAGFTVFTVSLTALSRILGISPNFLRGVAVVVLSIFALVMILPGLERLFERGAGFLVRRYQPERNGKSSSAGFLGGLPVGVSLGILWTPCVGPILASVITIAIASSIDAGAFVITLAYSLGTAIPMMAIMLGGRRLLDKFPGLHRNLGRIRRFFGVLMLFVAVSIGLGWDLRFQAAVLRAFPGYGENLTALENSDAVLRALDRREERLIRPVEEYTREGLFTGVGSDLSREGVAGLYGAAPPIRAQGPWINSDPLSMNDLAGKVVLIDFWTYSCINCIRTLPYLRDWHEKYSDKGFVILGVHSPEFAFERNPENVRKAVKDLDVRWPVVLDNGYDQWRSYANRFWPSHYLIDTRGQVRYFTFGEGHYLETEQMIRNLLIEGGSQVPVILRQETRQDYAATPETYLGAKRAERYYGEGELRMGTGEYARTDELPEHHWSLQGTWKVSLEYIEAAGDDSVLLLNFEARYVYGVLSPAVEPGGPGLKVVLDGGETVIPVAESRMYELASRSREAGGKLKLYVPEGTRLYSFTFGG